MADYISVRFDETIRLRINLHCGHTVCKSCLVKLKPKKCPFDQTEIDKEVEDIHNEFKIRKPSASVSKELKNEGKYQKSMYNSWKSCQKVIEKISTCLEPVSSTGTCPLSRPMQRKLISLANCRLLEDDGRVKAVKIIRSLAERTLSELILLHQNPQLTAANLWAAVRSRGCQFLGPSMQEEAIKLILQALQDGTALSRKVLVLFVVQRLQERFPNASKTSVGHVVQLLYRASCFIVTKREEDSSLMQLREELRNYDNLRREHDAQVVTIAIEAGLRIVPEQWSSLLYGNVYHKSYIQSIIDKVCKQQNENSFVASIGEFQSTLRRTGDPANLMKLKDTFECLSRIDQHAEAESPTWETLENSLKALSDVIQGLVELVQNPNLRRRVSQAILEQNTNRYKTMMCRDLMTKNECPRGDSCSFAHSKEELDRHRHKVSQQTNQSSLTAVEKAQLDALNQGMCAKLGLVPDNEVEVPTVQSSLLYGSNEAKMARTTMTPTSTTLTDGAVPIPSAQEAPEVPVVDYSNVPVTVIRPLEQHVLPHNFYPDGLLSNISLRQRKTPSETLHHLHKKKGELLSHINKQCNISYTTVEANSNEISTAITTSIVTSHLIEECSSQLASSSYKYGPISSSFTQELESELQTESNSDDEIIPFSTHSIVSKFGPIARGYKTKVKDIPPVQVTASQMRNPMPVTAVTPFSRGYPVAAPVPSRFSPTNPFFGVSDHVSDPNGFRVASSLPTAMIGRNLTSNRLSEHSYWSLKQSIKHTGEKNVNNEINADLAYVSDQMQLLQEAEDHRLAKELLSVEMDIHNTQQILQRTYIS
ncbi:DgyrCDS5974 [Dimorphilus gyrociliatus]|uniref:RING-type E3 ubiquitin transferase n=1 Tax=Dimorphilus gyrociliatus TaxID=2664684 RepID=A0A7I8VLJ8_9ANNE|nr:DgyrCDS5974 [Dimorphilus gyrociliatus]